MPTIKLPYLFAFTHGCAVTGRSKEGRNTSATSTHFFGQGALWCQLNLQLATHHLRFKEGVFADIGSDHFFDLPVFQEYAETFAIDAGIIGRNGETSGASSFDLCNQVFGNPAESETPCDDCHIIFEAF